MANEKIINLNNLKDFRQKNDKRYEEGKVEVGIAKQLKNISEESGSTQTAPFVFQATGTDDNTTETPTAPIAKHLQLRGNSVAWNQLVELKTDYIGVTGSVSYDSSTGTITMSGTYSSAGNKSFGGSIRIISGHKYYRKIVVSGTISENLRMSFAYYLGVTITAGTHNKEVFGNDIVVASGTNSGVCVFENMTTTQTFTNFSFSVMLIDLTQLGKEYSSVLEFNRDYPLPYYSYNAGQLLSCKANKLITIGFNQFNEEIYNGYWNASTGVKTGDNNFRASNDYIRVISGQSYNLELKGDGNDYRNILGYDKNKNFIGRFATPNKNETSFTIPNNVCYITFYFSATIYQGEVCLHLTWDGSRTGYAPYEKHEYNLPSIELRSAGDAYDEITPDGTHTTRIGTYTFTGNESWTKTSGSNGFWYTGIVSSTIKPAGSYYLIPNIVCSKIERGSPYDLEHTSKATICVDSYKQICLSSYLSGDLDLAGVRALTSGMTIYYELATPTTEQVSSFTENIIVDDFGTMEFVSAFTESANNPIVPQGNQFFYPADYVLLIDDLNTYVEGDITNLAKKSDLTASESDRDAVDNILKANIGGSLRHQLATKANIDFNNTGIVLDLSSLSWYNEDYATGRWKTESLKNVAKGNANTSSISNAICPLYKTISRAAIFSSTVGLAIEENGNISVYDASFSTVTNFKNAIKGIMLAYEKAS